MWVESGWSDRVTSCRCYIAFTGVHKAAHGYANRIIKHTSHLVDRLSLRDGSMEPSRQLSAPGSLETALSGSLR